MDNVTVEVYDVETLVSRIRRGKIRLLDRPRVYALGESVAVSMLTDMVNGKAHPWAIITDSAGELVLDGWHRAALLYGALAGTGEVLEKTGIRLPRWMDHLMVTNLNTRDPLRVFPYDRVGGPAWLPLRAMMDTLPWVSWGERVQAELPEQYDQLVRDANRATRMLLGTRLVVMRAPDSAMPYEITQAANSRVRDQ